MNIPPAVEAILADGEKNGLSHPMRMLLCKEVKASLSYDIYHALAKTFNFVKAEEHFPAAHVPSLRSFIQLAPEDGFTSLYATEPMHVAQLKGQDQAKRTLQGSVLSNRRLKPVEKLPPNAPSSLTAAEKALTIRAAFGVHALPSWLGNDPKAVAFIEDIKALPDAAIVERFGKFVDEKKNLGDRVISARDAVAHLIPTSPPVGNTETNQAKTLQEVWERTEKPKKFFTTWGSFVGFCKGYSHDPSQLEKIGVHAGVHVPHSRSHEEWRNLFSLKTPK